ncbi:DUF4190 domain-containing protein [Streptomyces sp. NRRL B-3648]|uniref:DUF4190 domain-containing protein n=1 Tax=Streptomyces sp. NRRL B-3648 TaxID=1519493 RepID=UPI000A6F450A|nr:DUF4190 domain-containing protein [Streptomyces sp. NRRL B-3648]
MSDEAPQPVPAPHPTGPDQARPRLSLAKEGEQGPTGAEPAARGGWQPTPGDQQAPGAGRAAPVADAAVPAAGRWTPPETGDAVPGADRESVQDAVPGTGSVHDAIPGTGSVHAQDRAAVPRSVPAPGTVHDQQTLTSLPAAAPADAGRAGWASPAGGFAPPTPGPTAQQPNPFAPPVHPFPPHTGTEAVPPPPIAPDGPGQVPYGYPGPTAAYGYPAPQQTPYAPYPTGTGYGWPGMQAPPSNGMGTASLVLGIISAVGFIAWPLAFVLGVLALIFGGIGRGKAARGEATNPGVALAGIICGAVGVVLVLGVFAVVIAARG